MIDFQGIFKQMSDSEHTFYLTGSRFFGNSTDKSDWDFFCQDSSHIRFWLQRHGFRSVSSAYSSKDVASVMYHPDGIHVQILRLGFLELKRRIQEAMRKHGVLPKDKEQAKRLWDYSLDLLDTSKGKLL